jgi:hypothetical protein
MPERKESQVVSRQGTEQGRSYVEQSGLADTPQTERFLASLDPGKNYV